MYYKETIVAGRTILRTLRASTRLPGQKHEKRKPKTNPTREAVMKVNDRNAVKLLTAKLNHNFKPGDLHITLTYKDMPTMEEAKKTRDKFIRNLRNHSKKNNSVMKWIAVTEYKHQRLHHHIVISGVDIELINKYWKHGYVRAVTLDGTGNYYKLAEYLLKETQKTFREENNPNKQRYTCSRNIITPKPHIEIMTGKQFRKEIKPDKGYYIDRDTVRKYNHAILGVECMEYILVSLDKDPRVKRWKKGRTGKYEKRYKAPYEEQLFMDLIPF